MAFDFSTLNEAQLEAVKLTEGPVLVTAGAGTGKTRLLTYRIAYLVSRGVHPENILAITFTNKATGEMKERILGNLEGGEQVTISTFHSLCVKILRANIHLLDEAYNKYFTIYDDSEQEKVLKKIFKEAGEDDDDFRKTVSYYISKAKNEGVTPEGFNDKFMFIRNADDIVKYYEKYENALKKNNALDFDDLIIKTIQLFVKRPDVLENYQNRFQYIHIDEFQDTNTVQYELAFMLAAKHHNILVVGDEDQSIYGWRGANYKNLFKFTEDFKEAKVIKLEENYRCSKEILGIANKLIGNNTERFDKVLYTSNDDGDKVDYRILDDDIKEAEYIARYISRKVAEGASYSDFACLFRVNSVSRNLESAFTSHGVPYCMFGGLRFYERAEIKNILAYLRVMINPRDEEALNRIINFPKRGIGAVTLNNLSNEAYEKGISTFEYILGVEDSFKNKGVVDFKNLMLRLSEDCEGADLVTIVSNLLAAIKLEQVYNSGTEEDYERLMNIKSFISAVNEFQENNDNATISDFLEATSLSTDLNGSEDNEGKVVLATVHAAKGLEFDTVFIVALEENLFPFAKSVEEGNLEEERRLMYVAITRAKKKLILTRARNRFSFANGGFNSYAMKSRFTGELGLAEDLPEGFRERPTSAFGGFYGDFGASKPTFSTSKPSQGEKFDAKSFLQGLKNVYKASDLYKDVPKADKSRVSVGTKVSHARFGEGIVKRINGNNSSNVTIEFESGTTKELNLDFAPIEILED